MSLVGTSLKAKHSPFQSVQPPWLPWKSLQQGGQKKEADFEVHPWLHPPCRRWNYGCCQFWAVPLEDTQKKQKSWELGGAVVTIERSKNKITLIAEVLFSKKYLKYLTKKYLRKSNLCDWLQEVANSKEELRIALLPAKPGWRRGRWWLKLIYLTHFGRVLE